jgi:hypothetical protein
VGAPTNAAFAHTPSLKEQLAPSPRRIASVYRRNETFPLDQVRIAQEALLPASSTFS